MSGGVLMADDDFIEVGRPLPKIRHAEALDAMKIRVDWADGRSEVIDLRPAIFSHRHFAQLRTDLDAFRSFAVRDEGDALVWPDGQELSALWIENLAPGSLENDEFRRAMEELQLSLDGMASRLGIARRLVADYRKDKPIPPAIAMATRFLLEHHRKAV